MTARADRITQLQRSLDRLGRELRASRRDAPLSTTQALHYALRRHGLLWKKVVHDGALVPRGHAAQDELYALLRHYSFRLFVRDVVKHRDDFALPDLLRYCSATTARRYLAWFRRRRLVRCRGGRFRLSAPLTSFGPTLEWYVAAVLQREYGIPSAWNLRFDGSGRGGDYDVIGFQDGVCVYIETKSSPPRNIEPAQVRAFFDRLDTLRPQVAVFLNDTQLRMRDKLAVLFAAELRRRAGRARALRLERLRGEVFVAGGQLFPANSAPDLAGNIGLCLAHYFRQHGFTVHGPA